MLEPDDRHYFSELLSPPPGFRLEKALGTTYSLELPALLMAPVALTRRSVDDAARIGRAEDESKTDDGDTTTPVSLVEAIRRASDRIALLCQRGRIKVPDAHTELYAFLDDAILELAPDNGSFHPKFWLLHFTDDATDGADEDRYRLVCTSRNLTHNRTWDFVVGLRGDTSTDAGASAAPLADFLQDTLTRDGLDRGSFDRRRLLESFAEDLRGVTFQPPRPYDEADLHLHGWDDASPILDAQPAGEQSLYISPFVTSEATTRLLDRTDPPDAATLVSRQQSLDELHEDVGESWSEWDRLDSHVLSVDRSLLAGDSEDDFAGLHAKIYATEHGDRTTWCFTSANLTTAGLGGGNVEFGVELRAPSDRAGLDDVLRTGDDDNMGFGNLLEPYHAAEEVPDDDESTAELNANAWRAYLADGHLTLRGSRLDDSREYELKLEFAPDGPPPDTPLTDARCWLASLSDEVDARTLSPDALHDETTIDLGRVSLLGLTPFVAFELSIEKPASQTIRFVLGASIEGIEADRTEAVLEHLIHNRDRFLQYLQYLLADADDYWTTRTQTETTTGSTRATRRSSARVELPLMEDVVEKCVANPARIYDVHSLLQSVRELDDSDEIIPEAFVDDVWLPVLRAIKPELTDEY